MLVGSTHHSEVVFVWKQNYILVDEYFFFCCTWIVNSAHLKDFADYCMSDRAPAGWFELLTERNTLFIKEYIKSNWQKENQVYKE